MTSLSHTIRHIIKPSWLFRKVLLINADRRLYTIVLIHLAMSAVIFTHFGMSKFHSQTEKVPEGAPYYSWKVGIPTFEFGTMHTILFQLTIIPLTMCRLLISKLWLSPIGDYFPFNEMTKFHIALGYTFIFLLFATIVVFLMFFGVLCNSGAQAFCDKFKTEIIITGYVIFVAFMSVGITSFLRFKIPYRVFYVVHHVVFIGYILTIMHTIDVVERKQGGRSQSFRWFSATLLLYVCDRAAMYITNRHTSVLVESKAIGSNSSDKQKMAIMKVKKPNLFHFYPGQYVYLKVPAVDNRWHPFSIGSAPESETLDFYIKVYKDTSWSGKVFKLLQDHQMDKKASGGVFDDNPIEQIKVEVLGAYGVGIGDKLKYSRALFVGSGTGFVPCLSLLHEHVNKCVTIDPGTYDTEVDRSSQNLDRLSLSVHNLSLVTRAMPSMDQSAHLIETIKHVHNAKIAKQQLVVNTITLFGPMAGVLMLGLTLSWHQLSFPFYPGMKPFLICGTIAYQLFFLGLVIYKNSQGTSQRNIWIFVDVMITILNAVLDWYCFTKDIWGGTYDPQHLVYYSILSLYMIFRFIGHDANAQSNPVEEMNKRKTGLVVFDKVRFVWVSRSAASIAQVYPEIEYHWDTLVSAWGLKRARQTCKISIFCTDSNASSCRDLLTAINKGSLFMEGAVEFGRPSFEEILDECTLEVLESSDTNASTSTLFAFCGSERLAKHVKEVKMFNDKLLSMTGNTQHSFDLVNQSYGGLVVSNGKREEDASAGVDTDHERISTVAEVAEFDSYSVASSGSLRSKDFRGGISLQHVFDLAKSEDASAGVAKFDSRSVASSGSLRSDKFPGGISHISRGSLHSA